MSQIVVGNARGDEEGYGGWWIGHFVRPATDLRATGAVEVKWGLSHTWQAGQDSVVLTVRWPSRAGDAREVEEGK